MPKRIILTGGHAATTAVATIEEILRRKENWELYWVGAKNALEGKEIPTIDLEIFPKMGVSLHPISAGRLQRKFSIWTIPSILKIPLGFIQAFVVLSKIKPNLILSFGGFVSFPVVFWGRIFGIPVILHEQTAVVGRSNKFSAFLATKIALAREQSINFFPKNKCVITGNPVMTQIAEIKPRKQIGDPPVIFVMGGSRGSLVVNELIEEILPKLLNIYSVIHLTGHLGYENALLFKRKLSKDFQARYEVYPRIDPLQIDGVYKRADIVIARAGANTVSEIMVVKIPSILIPIPWTYKDEQTSNAKLAVEFGVAKILPQGMATPSKLFELLQETRKNWKEIIEKVKDKKEPDVYASAKLVDLMEECAK